MMDPGSMGELRVLLVEDSQDDAELNLRELRRNGFSVSAHRVETASGLIDALSEQDWDLVLSDFQLPGFGGFEALRILQTSERDIPFILVSGAIGEEIAVSVLKAGAHDCVLKGNLSRLGPVVDRELREARTRHEKREAEQRLREAEERYRDLFQHSPVPTWVGDFSAVNSFFEDLRANGVSSIRAHLDHHPECVRQCVDLLRIVDMNQSGLALLGVRSREEASAFKSSFFEEESWPAFREEMIALAEGARSFSAEIAIRDVRGHRRILSFFLSVSPGFESSLGRVLVSFVDITERVTMEHLLKDSQASLEQAQRIAYLGSWEWDLNQPRPSWSPQMFELFGLSPENPPPTYDQFVMWIHPEDRPKVMGALEEVIASGDPWSVEYRIRRTDGTVRHVNERAELMLDDLDRPFRLRGTIQDITESWTVQEQLRQSEAQTTAVLENVEDIIVSRDLEGRCVVFNSAFARIVRRLFDMEAVPGLRTLDHLPEEAKAHWEEVLQTVHQGHSHREEFCWRFEGEETRHYETTLSPIWEQGRVIGSIEVNHDITKRKLMELALRDSEAKFSTLVAKAPVGIYMTDRFGRCNYVNERWCQMAGLTPEEAEGDGWRSGLHPEDRERVFADWSHMIASQGTWGTEYRFLDRQGTTTWVYGSATGLEDAQGATVGYIGINVDITERKGLENTLKDMERLTAKGQMAAYIAHEINNPLAGIKNAFTLVERAIPPDHAYARYGDLIKREIDRIAGIIRTMYHVYRPPSLEAKPVSIHQAFQDIEGLVEAKCRAAGVHCEIAMTDPRLSVLMNEGLVRQVLFNLVLNAIDASPDGGRIQLGAEREPGFNLITVEDEGSGIDPGLAERIFEPGFTTKRDSAMSGLGLGLATCRSILAASGGTLTFRSPDSGRGTRFEMRMPDTTPESKERP